MMKFSSIIFISIFFLASSFNKPLDLCPDLQSYTNLEEALKEPDNVLKLDLSMLKLTSVPKEIGKFPNLECLDLSFNRISDLPPEIVNLKKLKYLDLTGTNYMAKLPEVLKQLPSLQVLNVSDHRLWKPAQYEAAKKMLPNVKVICKSEYENLEVK